MYVEEPSITYSFLAQKDLKAVYLHPTWLFLAVIERTHISTRI